MRQGLWQHRDFVRLWQAATISTFGSMVTAIALPLVAILELDAGPRDLAALTFASYLPGAVISLVAGAMVDRFRRRRLLIAADLGRALLLLWVPTAAFLDFLSFPQLYLVAFGNGVFSVLFNVADKAYLPSVVADEDLVDANGKLAAGGSVAEASAFAGGGWLVQLLSAPVALLVDAVTFVVSALLIVRMQTPDELPRAGEADRSLRRDIAAGLQFLKRQPTLRLLAASNALRHFSVGVFLTLYMLFCVETLGLSTGLLGMVFALGSASSLIGASVASRVTDRFGIERALLLGYAVYAVAFTLIPLAPNGGWLGIALLAGHQLLGDGGETLFEVGEASTRQRLTPTEMLGRVGGSVGFLNSVAMLLGAVVAGEIGEWLGVRVTLFVSLAGVYLGLATLLLMNRSRPSASRSLKASCADASAP
jgi:MFS family permease